MKLYISIIVALLATVAVAAPAPQQKGAANDVNDAANNGEGVSSTT